MGETFRVAAATGALELAIPIASSRGRSGEHPELALHYSSGAGSGPFGVGWRLDPPSISRRTDKRLPRYRDGEDSDTFVFAGAEDLVPRRREDGTLDTRIDGAFAIRRYRPRVESGFARIERWIERGTADVHWRVTSKDGVTTIFGRTADARIADPGDPHRVFRWLCEEVTDPRGNRMVYEYALDNLVGVPAKLAEAERRRGPGAQRYLKRIRYANDPAGELRIEVVFDYGDHDPVRPAIDPVQPWPMRADPFSTFRAGFEIRTRRLCRRVLVFHRFGDPELVRSTELTYAEDPRMARLASVTEVGHAGDRTRAMPPLALGYTDAHVGETVHDLDGASLENLRSAVDGAGYRWVDLDGEGLPGVLTEQAQGWFYKRNLGGTLGPIELAFARPSTATLGSGGQIVDLGGDGGRSLVSFEPGVAGYYERTNSGGFAPFAPFDARPNLDWRDRNLRLVDLDGDGRADALISEDELFRWYPSLGRGGFADGEAVAKPLDDDAGPRLIFDDGTESLRLADMTGDGLSDLVRIRNGEVSYWPNLGYGRFGRKVEMTGAPVFELPDLFRQDRVRLADIDGSGTTDVMYLGRDGVRFWINQAGNGFGAGQAVAAFPRIDKLDTVGVVDVRGNGTGCLVWSSPAPADAARPLRYVELTSGVKPNLLDTIVDNRGGETRIDHAPSTRFYLEDRAVGRPWATRLPFPVQVVASVDQHDRVTGSRLRRTYRYHHGHYDPIEREFGGFGMVESEDAESFDHFAGDATRFVAPVLTKTWYHTGAFLEEETLAQRFAAEFFAGDPDAPRLADAERDPSWSAADQREACRALRGFELRHEVYALDTGPLRDLPYAVVQARPFVRREQAGVFYAHEREKLEIHYERRVDDPRVTHSVTLEVDAFGNVRRAATLGYARRGGTEPEQLDELVRLDEATFVNLDAGAYRVGIPIETRSYELTGIGHAGAIASVGELAGFTGSRRLVAAVRHRYWRDDLGGDLPLGEATAVALPHRSYTLAFTPELIAEVYAGRVDALPADARYMLEDGGWWAPSALLHFDRGRFDLPVRIEDVFGNTSSVDYDAAALLVTRAEDAAGNVVAFTNDYRILAPVSTTDANGNVSAVRVDELGVVVATAIGGKPGLGEGQTLDDPTTTFDYDALAWIRDSRPIVVHARARETDAPDTRYQDTYVYFDGSGRTLQTKSRAEPGDDGAERWVGSGRVVYDNKANPVKQYEPFFSTTPGYESDDAVTASGVASVLTYDPLARRIRTDHPDGTFTRVVFDAWRQETWDETDTVLDSDWLRRVRATGAAEDVRAADLASAHARTPAVADLDVLGRPFLTIEDAGVDGQFQTRHVLDLLGNSLAVIDARGNRAEDRTYDLRRTAIAVTSADAGTVQTFADAAGRLVWTRSARGIEETRSYDMLARLVEVRARRDGGAQITCERVVHGESHPEALARNLRGRVFQQFDQAGVATSERYDFRGHLIESSRQLAIDDDDLGDGPDWATAPAVSGERFVVRTEFDVLGRPVLATAPDGSQTRPIYNEAGLLERMEVRAAGAAVFTPFVSDVDYNARRQRARIAYGNGAETRYGYDPLTFRLVRLETTRPDRLLQDLRYTFDPVGNITEIVDAAWPTVFFGNTATAARSTYEYDAVYRLKRATGREHGGQQPNASDLELVAPPAANDAAALRPYEERYRYDAVGNLLEMRHLANGAGWTRRYDVERASNRLRATSLPGDLEGVFSASYAYDARGNTTRMPHLVAIEWDHVERLRRADLGGGGTVGCAYASTGERVRRTVRRIGGRIEELISLGMFEVFRVRRGATIEKERRTLHVLDDKRRIALVETLVIDAGAAVSTAPLVRYQLDNHLQSSAIELDAAAQIISYEEYHPFGTSSYRAGTAVTETSAKRYRYIGKERDEDTGFSYYGARYLVPWLGRWTSCDPAGLVDGTNLYHFVRNNPVTLIDRDGMKAGPLTLDDVAMDLTSDSVKRNVVGLLNRLLSPGSSTTEDRLLATRRELNTTIVVRGLQERLGGVYEHITRQVVVNKSAIDRTEIDRELIGNRAFNLDNRAAGEVYRALFHEIAHSIYYARFFARFPDPAEREAAIRREQAWLSRDVNDYIALGRRRETAAEREAWAAYLERTRPDLTGEEIDLAATAKAVDWWGSRANDGQIVGEIYRQKFVREWETLSKERVGNPPWHREQWTEREWKDYLENELLPIQRSFATGQ